MPQPMPLFDPGTDRPLLATDKVRHVGELLAAVIAESAAQAQDAAELVIVDYEPLPVVVDVTDAALDNVLLFDDLGTNTVFGMPPTPGEASFDDCDVVVELTVNNQRLAPCPIEPRVSTAEWVDGRLIQHVGSQGAHPVRDQLAQIYGLEPGDVRVVTPDVGGGFGARAFAHAEELVLGAVARHVGATSAVGRDPHREHASDGPRSGPTSAHPHRWHARRASHRIRSPCRAGRRCVSPLRRLPAHGRDDDADRRLRHHQRRILVWLGRHQHHDARAYRGAGRPEATGAIERAIDRFAAEIEMDPAEVRRRNLLAPFDETHMTATGMPYDSGNYPEALERVLNAAGYDELRAEQARRRDAGEAPWLGIGLSVYVEITALGNPGEPMGEHGAVELQPDGSVVATTGSSPHGQGHYTSWAMLISDELGDPDGSHHRRAWRHRCGARRGNTGGSRSAQIAGSSIQDAAKRLVDAARERAADQLEAALDDIVLDTERGVFHVVGAPAVTLDWAELAASTDAPLVGCPSSPNRRRRSRSERTARWSRSTLRPERSSSCEWSRSMIAAR